MASLPKPALSRASTAQSMGQTATPMARNQQQQPPTLLSSKQQPSSSSQIEQKVPGPLSTDGAVTAPVAKCDNCKKYGPNCFVHGKKMRKMGPRRGMRSAMLGSDVLPYHGHSSFKQEIHPAVTDHVKIRRTYRTNMAVITNTNGSDYFGGAYSFACAYNSDLDSIDCSIVAGAPANGTPIVGLSFGEIQSEFAWLMKVFRYVKPTKFQINVVRAPQNVMMQTMTATSAGEPTVVQVGNASNLGDPGRVLLRPWAGQPGVANFTNGILTENDWANNWRYKLKKTAPATSSHGFSEVLSMCVTPVQVVEVEDEAAAVGGNVIQYVPSPTVDWSYFQSGTVNMDGLGHVVYWYFPGMIGGTTGFMKLYLYWEIEFEIFGLKKSDGVEAGEEKDCDENGTPYSDSREALIAAISGTPIKTVDRPGRKPIDPSLMLDLTALQYKMQGKEVPQPQVNEDYVQISTPASTPRK